jgi:hypothetical protein
VARRGEPISATQATVVVLTLAAGSLVDYRLVGGSVGLVAIFAVTALLQVVVQPVSTLIHELGHAAAVRALGKRGSVVVVGRGPWIKIGLGRITARFSLLPSRGVLMGGLCQFDVTGLPWRSIGWIALAGPLATLVELLALLTVAPLLWSRGAFVRQLIFLWAVYLVASVLVNLSPRRQVAGSRHAVVAQCDGWRARQAFARHRAGFPVPRPAAPAQPSVTVRVGTGSQNHTFRVPTDPEQRRRLAAELAQAKAVVDRGGDPASLLELMERIRIPSPPATAADEAAGNPERRRDLDRAANSIPPPGHPGRRAPERP